MKGGIARICFSPTARTTTFQEQHICFSKWTHLYTNILPCSSFGSARVSLLFQIAKALKDGLMSFNLINAVRTAGAHPSLVLLDIQNLEALACIPNPLLNKQGWTSISYPSQTPDIENNTSPPWSAFYFACVGMKLNPTFNSMTNHSKHDHGEAFGPCKSRA